MTINTPDMKVKLTKSQAEILGKMQSGDTMYTDRDSIPMLNNRSISKTIFKNLREKGMIAPRGTCDYVLTDLGRTLDLTFN